MIKLIKKLIGFIILLLLLGLLLFVGKGYLEYKEVTDEAAIETKVNDLRNKSNYTVLSDININMQNAQIAIEDKRFYKHGAIDIIGTVRALVVNIKSESLAQGGSTITQQLAKNFYFMDDNNGTKKIAEAFVAHKLESLYSKEEILEMYLNIVYYGDNNYGIYEASINYFNTKPQDLSIAQSSMLAGLVQAPSVYALSNHDNRTYIRQRQVLKAMLDQDYINQNEYDAALNETVY